MNNVLKSWSSLIVRVNVVLNRSVFVDSDWCFWLWRRLPHRLSKCQSLSTKTVLFRTMFTRMIKLNLFLKWLLGSNLSQNNVHQAKIVAMLERYMAISRGSTVAQISHFHFYHQKYKVSKSKIKNKELKVKMIMEISYLSYSNKYFFLQKIILWDCLMRIKDGRIASQRSQILMLFLLQ